MTLQDWLQQKRITETAFADMVGVKPSAVNRLMPVDGRAPLRKPGWKLMSVIATVTGGAVMPNDFMEDLPEIGDEDDDKPPQPSDAACDTDPIRRAS